MDRTATTKKLQQNKQQIFRITQPVHVRKIFALRLRIDCGNIVRLRKYLWNQFMGVYVIREGLAEADELLPSWGLGTGQVWCMVTLTCLCLQEWDGTSASNEGYPKVRNHGEGPY